MSAGINLRSKAFVCERKFKTSTLTSKHFVSTIQFEAHTIQNPPVPRVFNITYYPSRPPIQVSIYRWLQGSWQLASITVHVSGHPQKFDRSVIGSLRYYHHYQQSRAWILMNIRMILTGILIWLTRLWTGKVRFFRIIRSHHAVQRRFLPLYLFKTQVDAVEILRRTPRLDVTMRKIYWTDPCMIVHRV